MKFVIPEIRQAGLHRLGRNFNHDPRSLLYKVQPATVDKSAEWTRRVPVWDQGNLGSCTGNAEAGLLGTDPFWPTLSKEQQDTVNEDLAVKIYSEATEIDPYAGTYPPTDTGSDGLSVSKAAKALGYIKGYIWATSVAEAQTLIQQGPFIIGTIWTSNMDRTNAAGFIANPAQGSVRGGHEYECWKRDAEADRWWFFNSWGDSWGYRGMFCYDSAGLAALLSRGGDITQSVALDKPPPEPTPDVDPDLAAWWTSVKKWATAPSHTDFKTPADKAAHACIDFAKKKGL